MALNYTKAAHLQPELPGGKTNYIGDIILELNSGISSNGIRPRGYESLGIQNDDGTIHGDGIYLQTFADGSIYFGDGDTNRYLFGSPEGISDNPASGVTIDSQEPCMFGTEFTVSGTPDAKEILLLRSFTNVIPGKKYITCKTSYGTVEIYKNSTLIGYNQVSTDCLTGDMIHFSVIAPVTTHNGTKIRVTEHSVFSNGFGAWSESTRHATQLDYDIYLPNNEFLFFVEYEGIPQDSTIQILSDKHIGIDFELNAVDVANIKKYSTTSTNRMLGVFYRGSLNLLVNGKVAATKNVMKMRKDSNGNSVVDTRVNEPITFLKHFGAKVFKVLILSDVDSLILDQFRLERISIDGFEEGYESKELVPLFTQYETSGTGGGGIPPVVVDALFVGVYATWADLPGTVFGQQWGIAGEGFYQQTGATNASRRLIWGCATNSEVDNLFV